MIDSLLVHASTIEVYQGMGPHGPLFGPPATVRCFVDDETRVVRTDSGEESVSHTTVYYPAGTVVPAGSRVTVLGRSATVLMVSRMDSGGLSPLDHVEVALD